MKKRAILIDGNNLLFRSYYATAYNGNLMKNSKGFPTNALYGFINMLNKIINEENPEYIMVAFDKGHNFRQDMYDNYKDGRIETPQDLKIQFKEAKEICTLLGIKYIECDNYEADDIIGTFARMADEDKNYNATIISSDKDLLQLISDEVNVKLLKQKDYIMMDENKFMEVYGIKPIRMIDLKSLMGDASDNIKGILPLNQDNLTHFTEYIKECPYAEYATILHRSPEWREKWPALKTLAEQEGQLRINIQVISTIPVAEDIFRDNYVKSRESATIHKKLRELLGLSVDKKNFVFGNVKRPRVEQ